VRPVEGGGGGVLTKEPEGTTGRPPFHMAPVIVAAVVALSVVVLVARLDLHRDSAPDPTVVSSSADRVVTTLPPVPARAPKPAAVHIGCAVIAHADNGDPHNGGGSSTCSQSCHLNATNPHATNPRASDPRARGPQPSGPQPTNVNGRVGPAERDDAHPLRAPWRCPPLPGGRRDRAGRAAGRQLPGLRSGTAVRRRHGAAG
jgi:hypothetical protein